MDPRRGGEPIIAESQGRCADARTRWPRPVYRPTRAARADCLRQRPRGLSGGGLPFSLLLHLAVLIPFFYLPGSRQQMASLEVFVAGQPTAAEEALGTEPSPTVPPREPRRPPWSSSALQSSTASVPPDVSRRIEPAEPSAVDDAVGTMTEVEGHRPSLSVPSPSQIGVHLVVEPKAGRLQDERRRSLPPVRMTRPGPRAVVAAVKPDASSSASSAASRPERGTLPKADVPESITPNGDAAQAKSGPIKHEPVVTARALPLTPPDTGGEPSAPLQIGSKLGGLVTSSIAQSNTDEGRLPASTAFRPEPPLAAVVESTPVPSVHDPGTTAERRIESISPQPATAETATVPHERPRPVELEPVITSRAAPTMGIGARTLPAPSNDAPPAALAVGSKIRSEPEPGSALEARRSSQPGTPEAPGMPGRSERQPVVTTRVRRKTPSESSPLPAPGAFPPALDASRDVDVPPPAPSLPERETTAGRSESPQSGQVATKSVHPSPEKEITGLASDPVVRIAEAPPASGGTSQVDSVATPATKRIVITSPANGLRLAPDDPPIVVVEGEVEDATVSRVWLIANDRRIAVPVQSGRFRQALVILDSALHIHAEVEADGGAHRTAPISVHSTSSSEFGIVMIEWPRGSGGRQVDVTARWRSSPDRLDAPARTFPLRPVTWLNEGSTQAFYFRRPKPGVYSFVLHQRGSGVTGELIQTLYLPREAQLARLVPKPIATDTTGPLLLGRVLLPWGVLWEQDDWFTGRVESVGTVTKFRMPEGVSWTEGRNGSP